MRRGGPALLPALLLCAALLPRAAAAPDEEWIDPTDMLNYDAAAGAMRRPYKVRGAAGGGGGAGGCGSRGEIAPGLWSLAGLCDRTVDAIYSKR